MLLIWIYFHLNSPWLPLPPICMYVCMYIYASMYVDICMYVCMYIYACMYVYTCMHVCITNARAYEYIHGYYCLGIWIHGHHGWFCPGIWIHGHPEDLCRLMNTWVPLQACEYTGTTGTSASKINMKYKNT